jgi:hypothetical protein
MPKQKAPRISVVDDEKMITCFVVRILPVPQHTQVAYARAAKLFLAWCERRGIWKSMRSYICLEVGFR